MDMQDSGGLDKDPLNLDGGGDSNTKSTSMNEADVGWGWLNTFISVKEAHGPHTDVISQGWQLGPNQVESGSGQPLPGNTTVRDYCKTTLLPRQKSVPRKRERKNAKKEDFAFQISNITEL